jgi:hypothetical protein
MNSFRSDLPSPFAAMSLRAGCHQYHEYNCLFFVGVNIMQVDAPVLLKPVSEATEKPSPALYPHPADQKRVLAVITTNLLNLHCRA